MKQVQKRYIYSALTSSLFFIISYGIINMNILICIILTSIIYIGGILLFKGKDIREFNSENINNYYFLASKVANQANSIDNVKIRQMINKISSLTDQIIVSLEQRPKKVEQVFDFFDYYLDITYKVLFRYNNTINKTDLTTEEKAFIEKTIFYLEKIVQSFEKQLKNMQEARMLDINSEINIFEKTVGLKNNDMQVGEKNAER